MRSHVSLRRAAVKAGVGAFLGLSAIFGIVGPSAAPASAMSCFAIADTVTCIGTTTVPTPPFMPPVIVPQGANVDGENEHIVIRDDGGRHIARG